VDLGIAVLSAVLQYTHFLEIPKENNQVIQA
jgi:hypothetical protein